MKQLICLCIAITVIGSACKKEKKGLAAITTTPPTNVTANSVQTGGAITNDGNSPISKKGVAWATHTTPTVADSITNDGSGTGTFTTNITGINANTTYYIRAYAINASGTAYGDEISFTTSKGLATITTTSISNIAPLSASSGGSITNDGGAAITARGVVWSTSANPTTANFKTSDGSGTGSFTSSMSPLASQTTYYVRAYATNSYGTSYGNQVQFNAASANTVTDVEGNVYPYVTLCGKSWMATNLKVSKYRNGDPITDGSATNFNWTTTTVGAYAFPNGVAANNDAYGKLYNYQAIKDSRGVCPAGWHAPSESEWNNLLFCSGMSAADTAKKGDDYYPGVGTIGGTLLEGGSSGLNLKKGGYLWADPATHYSRFSRAGVYASSPIIGGLWIVGFNFGEPDAGPVYRSSADYGVSVRCVKD